MSWYAQKSDDENLEEVTEARRHRREMLIDAWQFDGEVLNLGFICRRLNRYRLADVGAIEALRWKVLCYQRNRVQPRYAASLVWLRKLGEAFFTDEDGYTARFTPSKYGYNKGSVRTNTRLPPLMQLAEIPDITDEKLRCGKELLDVGTWSISWMRRAQCLDAALMTALYANSYIRDRVDESGRGQITINGRVYAVRSDWLTDPPLVATWPQPGDATFSIGT